ncbi:uncharacterized protein [Periplaneta americana]|uniref:uncharacterized protein n=1 Tax=Periplaneta americana TaxID=6978 RepID=UPI0037E6F89D
MKYKKTSGFANMSGELYEVKILALIFSRSLQNMQYSTYLASNMLAAGAFDDIVLKREPKGGTCYDISTDMQSKHLKNFTILFQLKHELIPSNITDSQLLQLKGNFSLLKYYKSYCKMKQEWSQKKDLQFCGKFEDFIFVLYTNSNMARNVPVLNQVDCSDLWQNFIKTGENCFCFTNELFPDVYEWFQSLPKCKDLLAHAVNDDHFESEQELLGYVKKLLDNNAKTLPDKEQLKDLLKQLDSLGDLSDHEEFLSRLWFFTSQASEKQLNALVSKEIEILFGTSTPFKVFLEKVQDWWRNSNIFLTENIHFWQKMVESCVNDISNSMIQTLSKLEIEFKDNELMDKLSSTGTVVHVVNDGTYGANILSFLKVYQSLGKSNILLADDNTLQNRLSEALAMWKWCKALVIQNSSLNRDNVVKQIIDILQRDPYGKCLVIIGDSADKVWKLCEQIKYLTYDDSFKMTQLDERSQNRIGECEIDFQGYLIRLSSLVSVNVLCDIATADDVVQLLTGDTKLEVGQKLMEQDKCYISRTLLRRECIQLSIFSAKQPDLVVVSGITEKDLKQLMPSDGIVEKFGVHPQQYRYCWCLIIDGITDFVKLCTWPGNIHWLHKQERYFIWKQSKGDATIVRKHIAQNVDYIRYNNIKEVIECPHQMVLLVSEPGMGKSTELAHFALELKITDPSRWVVRVNLNDYGDDFRQHESSVIELLVKAGKINTKFQRFLFKHEISNGGNVDVMLDGFDEISPKFVEKVLSMLRELAGTNIKKVWVTSRPVTRETLELELSSLPFVLEPFSRNDQHDFLLKFWGEKLTYSCDLSEFITKLLDLTVRSLNDRLGAFTGIPLQTKMLAEAFLSEALQFCKSGDIKLPHKLDLLQLYDTFVEQKWHVYYEKNKLDTNRVGVSENCQVLKEKLREDCMICALQTLLGPGEIKQLHNSKKITREFQKILKKLQNFEEKIGIVMDVINDRPLFTHRTFAEYFAAMWFADNFEDEENYLKDKIFDLNFQIVRTFFDRILAEELELHVAVLNQDKNLIETLLSKSNINDTDKGGRTALHLAVMSYIDKNENVDQSDVFTDSDIPQSDDDSSSNVLQNIVSHLLDNGADFNVKDEVLSWTPLRLADKIKAWSAIELLLRKEADQNDLVLTLKNIGNDEYVQEILRAAAKHGYTDLAKFMLQHGVSVDYPITVTYEWGSDTKATMLHEASRYGQLEMMQLLLQQGAKIEAYDSAYDSTAIMWAVQSDQMEAVKLLISQKANVNTRDWHDNTPFLRAVRNGRNDIAILLSQHADVKAADKHDYTALHHVAVLGNVEVLTYFLGLGLDINHCSKDKQTPLWCAAWSDHVKDVQLLCEQGADLYIQDNVYGYTPLHIAAAGGYLDVVKCLVNHDSESPSSRDKDNKTPLDVAEEWEHHNVVEFLQQKMNARMDSNHSFQSKVE